MRDISERKRADATIRESQELLSGFMNSATDGFAILDHNLTFVDVNTAISAMFGFRIDEFVGRNIAELTPAVKNTGRYEQYLRVINTGEPYRFEGVVAGRDSARPRRVSGTAFKVGMGWELMYRT